MFYSKLDMIYNANKRTTISHALSYHEPSKPIVLAPNFFPSVTKQALLPAKQNRLLNGLYDYINCLFTQPLQHDQEMTQSQFLSEV